MPRPISHLLYLHGFRSSPQSAKAQGVARHMAARHPGIHWWCPQLPPSPRDAAALIDEGTANWPAQQAGVIGSSLGGFYATRVAQRPGWRTVLLNPAVHPARDLARHIGQQAAWHDPGQHFFFRPEFIDELKALEAGPLVHPERVMAIIAQGDEVLDWREMVARYPGSHLKLLPGGDHALSDFEQAHLGPVLAFFGLE